MNASQLSLDLLVGRTFSRVYACCNSLRFYGKSSWYLQHHPVCWLSNCRQVTLEKRTGDLLNLVDVPILKAEVARGVDFIEGEKKDWHLYSIQTEKGIVTARFSVGLNTCPVPENVSKGGLHDLY